MTKTPLALWENPKYPYVFCHTEGEEEYLAYTTEEGNEMSRYNSKEIEHVVRNHKLFISEELSANVKKRMGVYLLNLNFNYDIYFIETLQILKVYKESYSVYLSVY